MLVLSGTTVKEGIAIGPVFMYQRSDQGISFYRIEDIEEQVRRIDQAMLRAKAYLQTLYEKTRRENDEKSAEVFSAHPILLEDNRFYGAICQKIRKEQVSAEYAVSVIGEELYSKYMALNDAYIRSRAIDMKDIADLMLDFLQGENKEVPKIETPSVLLAQNLTPSEMADLDKENVLAIVMREGSIYSHTAMLARNLDIPVLFNVDINMEKIEDGMLAMVDGYEGCMVLQPSEDIRNLAEEVIRQKKPHIYLKHLIGKESVTRKGKRLLLYANMNHEEELESILENDAEGIGLLRSEFLFMNDQEVPSEEVQFDVYKNILTQMGQREVVIRTLDIGVDKLVDYYSIEKQENPAMGYRGIRISLNEPELFKTQIRALFRAGVYGNLSVMYPMITSVEEVERIQVLVKEVIRELQKEQMPYKVPKQGIMIETPAAVMISDELATMVDFFSIGTNDLTQYTLAMDRQNAKVQEFYQPYHRAITRMIRMTVINAHKAGIPVGICGELAGDPALAESFVRGGIDWLSVVPSRVLKLRKTIRELNV